MDENKRTELTKFGFKIQPCCGLCAFGRFQNDEWGTCGLHMYKHQKHIGDEREVSIHKYGSCPEFIEAWKEANKLGPFIEFFISYTNNGIE